MRVSALTAATAILIAALPPQPAQARQGSIIYWRMNGDARQVNPSFARDRFQQALNRFAAEIRRHPRIARSQFAQLTRFDYRSLPDGFAGEDDAPAQRDRENALAVMWGDVTLDSRQRYTAYTSI